MTKTTTMTRTKLIDKAIDDLDGVFQPKGDYFFCGRYGLNTIKYSLFYRSDSNFICSQEEFEQRKKEREMENNNWYDYDKNCNVALPPVDTVCEYTLSDGRTWYKCKVISHNNLVLDCPHLESMDNNGLQVLHTDADTVKFRPLDWDKLSKRKQAINYAIKLSPDWAKLDDIFGFLYDAGMLKLPEEK